jgi:hypothetical protein
MDNRTLSFYITGALEKGSDDQLKSTSKSVAELELKLKTCSIK